MFGVVAALLLAMQIEGGGNCPSPGDVKQALAPLLPPAFAATATDRALIAERPDGSLSIALARPDGSTVASRRLPRARTCAEQAETVAVTLAVWEAQVHPEISLRLDSLAGAPATAVTPAAASEPPATVAAVARAQAPEAAAAPTTWVPALGVAAVGSWQPGSAAPGARIDTTLRPAGGGWRARLSLTGVGLHTSALEPGAARWWRLYAALGADYGHPLGRRWQLRLGIGGAVGALGIEGSGFTVNRTRRNLDLGAEATLRAELRLRAVTPWLGVAVVAWLRQQTLEITGDTPRSTVLPLFEPMLVLGADFCSGC